MSYHGSTPTLLIVSSLFVHLLGASSTPQDLDYGVFQGSVLGLFCFSVYLLPLGKIITVHHSGRKYTFWANDSQLYFIFGPFEVNAVNDNMEISSWI